MCRHRRRRRRKCGMRGRWSGGVNCVCAGRGTLRWSHALLDFTATVHVRK